MNDKLEQESNTELGEFLSRLLNNMGICVTGTNVNQSNATALDNAFNMDSIISKDTHTSNVDEDDFLKEYASKIFDDLIEKLKQEIKVLDDSSGQLINHYNLQIEFRNNEIKLKRKALEEEFNKLEKIIQDRQILLASILEQMQKDIDIYTLEKKKELDSVNQASIKELESILEDLKKKLSNLIIESYYEFEKMLSSQKETLNGAIKKIDLKLQEADRKLNSINNKKNTIADELTKEVVQRVIKMNPAKEINITLDKVKKKTGIKGLFHQDFEKILKLVYLNIPAFLVGPAGCGKNVIIKQIANVLNLDFYYINDATEPHKLLGFMDANGRYVETQFFKAFTKGGLCMVDELDNSEASVLLLLNSAIGTGNDFYMTFPDGNQYKPHMDFHLVAAANTFGTGETQIYCGRNQLDGASLNRFLAVQIDYDKELEKSLIVNKDLLPLYWEVRDIVRENAINYVVSTRNIVYADTLISANCFSMNDILDWTIIGSMTKDDLNIIVSRINTNDKYSIALLNHLKNKYQVNKNEYNDNNSNNTSYSRDRAENQYDGRYGFNRGGYYGY